MYIHPVNVFFYKTVKINYLHSFFFVSNGSYVYFLSYSLQTEEINVITT